jgi:hypothetical protein
MSVEAMKQALEGKSLYEITGSITDIDKCIIHRFDLIQAIAEAEKQEPKEPLTDYMVVAAARVLNKRAADACNIDEADSWNIYGDEYISDARAALEAALGIGKE